MAMDKEVLTFKVEHEKAEKFRDLCAAKGIRLTMILRGAVEEFVRTGDVSFPVSEDLAHRRRLGITSKAKINA